MYITAKKREWFWGANNWDGNDWDENDWDGNAHESIIICFCHFFKSRIGQTKIW